MKNATTLEQFSELLHSPEKKQKCYYTGTRRGQIQHARLRLKCSDLNDDLYNKNLVVSPACTCGDPHETADHYFHDCTNYRQERTTLHHEIYRHCPITTDLLLFGNPDADDDTNTDIFDKVQKFILQTNRFN